MNNLTQGTCNENVNVKVTHWWDSAIEQTVGLQHSRQTTLSQDHRDGWIHKTVPTVCLGSPEITKLVVWALTATRSKPVTTASPFTPWLGTAWFAWCDMQAEWQLNDPVYINQHVIDCFWNTCYPFLSISTLPNILGTLMFHLFQRKNKWTGANTHTIYIHHA